jgi:hypothetical protein
VFKSFLRKNLDFGAVVFILRGLEKNLQLNFKKIMGTKNNPKNRVKAAEKKKFNGKEIEPAYYYGVHAGHGKYMAAKYAGTPQLVLNSENKPMQWDEIN